MIVLFISVVITLWFLTPKKMAPWEIDEMVEREGDNAENKC